MPKAMLPVPLILRPTLTPRFKSIKGRVVLTREIVSIHFFGKPSSFQVTQRRAPRGFQTVDFQRPGCERVQAFSDRRDTGRAIAAKRGVAGPDAPRLADQSAGLAGRLYLCGPDLRSHQPTPGVWPPPDPKRSHLPARGLLSASNPGRPLGCSSPSGAATAAAHAPV